MRLTTLLDTTSHTTTPISTSATSAAPIPELPLTRREGRKFAQLVAGLAPCRSNDPELWFAEQAEQVERAKAMCQQCPLVAACLSGALDRAEPWGVWGGEVFVDGVVVARKRGRGRPRKDRND